VSAVTAETAYSIVYEKQSDAESNRTCGAACLAMVYGSLGKEVPQSQIWPAIAKVNPFGNIASTTHLMVRDALSRGFDAVALQARHPWYVLRLCRDAGIRVILNHRLHAKTAAGHYTVMVDIGERDATLHDPYLGPNRRLSHAGLAELWGARPDSEIAGGTLIAIAARQPAEAACEICGAPIPASVACPQCGDPIALRPAAVLGCIGEACIVRHWNYVCCPSCDYMWDLSAAPPRDAARAESGSPPDEPKGAADDSLNLDEVFAPLDKFCAFILAMPEAAGDPDVMQQIAFIKDSKEKLKEAQIQEFAIQKAHEEKMAALVQEAEQKEEAHRQKVQALTTPSPPLDGTALGWALLRNVGLIR
jgi:hypothetical protein